MQRDKKKTVTIVSLFTLVLLVGLGFDLIFNHSIITALEPYRRISELISLLGHGWMQVLVIALLFFYSRKSELDVPARQALRGASMSGAVAYVIGGVVVQAIKHLVGRPRPYMEDPWGFVGLTMSNRFGSFPSGHTTTSFAIAYALAAYFPRWRWVFYGLAGLVGLSRITLGKHYPLDVAAGALLGIGCGWLSVRWIKSKAQPK